MIKDAITYCLYFMVLSQGCTLTDCYTAKAQFNVPIAPANWMREYQMRDTMCLISYIESILIPYIKKQLFKLTYYEKLAI